MSRFVRRLALGVWGCVVFAGVNADAGPIFSEDFEAFDTFWANPGTPISVGGWTFENHAGVELHSGNQVVRLESNGSATSDPTIAQVVSGLSAGTLYQLSWDWALRVKFSGSGTDRSFGVFLDTQDFANALFLGERLDPTFTRTSVDFVATSTSHTIIFAGELDARSNGLTGTDSRTDVSYRLDNVEFSSLTSVPEPASLALFGLGSILLFPAARRRRGTAEHRMPCA